MSRLVKIFAVSCLLAGVVPSLVGSAPSANIASSPKALSSCERFIAKVAREKRIRKFLKRFKYKQAVIGYSTETWTSFIESLSQIDFSRPGPYWLDLFAGYPGYERRRVQISDSLVSGWRKLGLVRESGEFDLEASREEVAKKFFDETGIRMAFPRLPYLTLNHREVSLEGKEVRKFSAVIRPHDVFIRNISEGLYPVADVHDILFHAAWLMSSKNRDLYEVAIGFDQALGISRSEDSLLNDGTEGLVHTHSRSDVLLGVIQIFRSHIKAPTHQTNDSKERALARTLWFLKDPGLYNRERLSDPSYFLERKYIWWGRFQDEATLWFHLLSRMKLELDFRVHFGKDLNLSRDDAQLLSARIGDLMSTLHPGIRLQTSYGSFSSFELIPGHGFDPDLVFEHMGELISSP